MFINIQENFWYNLEHHATRRNDFKEGESDFTQFYGNDSPKGLKFLATILKFSKLKILNIQMRLEKKLEVIWKNGDMLGGVPHDD